MTEIIAKQIADLLNKRNKLSKNYSAEEILNEKNNYVFEIAEESVIACAEAKKIQWYQWEICHVSVSEKGEGKGFGYKILLKAEEKAIAGNAKILQCTIREDNTRSAKLFERNGYSKTASFYNTHTSNYVNVYQKSVSNKA